MFHAREFLEIDVYRTEVGRSKEADLRATPIPAETTTRATALRRAILGGGALAAGGILGSGFADESSSEPSAAQDARILNFALQLEYVQAGFYDEALRSAGLTGEMHEFAHVARAHERAHVAFLRRHLGDRARPAPALRFGDATRDPHRFAAAAVTLEDLAVLAYNGQATNLTRPALAAAAEIVSVEARHAAWVRDIVGKLPAPRAQDPLWSATRATRALTRTGFVEP
jgi:Ferritin-like domain